jgi:hypothetical protein
MVFGGIHKKDSKITFFILQSKFYSFVLNIADAFVRHQFRQLAV